MAKGDPTRKMLGVLRQQQEMVTEIGNWLFRLAEYLKSLGFTVPMPPPAAPRFIHEESSFLAVCVGLRTHIDELMRDAKGAKSSAPAAARSQTLGRNTPA